MTETTARPLAALAAELLETLQPLLELPLTAAARDGISRAHAIALALHGTLTPISEPAINRSIFYALLEIAGEETTPKLLQQVLLDLGNVRSTLPQAILTVDWPALRQQSHILMSIAGSFGAISLHHDAEALNRVSHACDALALADLQGALQTKLDALLLFLAEEAEKHGQKADAPGSVL